jgi:hypothetical protein
VAFQVATEEASSFEFEAVRGAACPWECLALRPLLTHLALHCQLCVFCRSRVL